MTPHKTRPKLPAAPKTRKKANVLGRPSKMTQDVQDKAAEAISIGATKEMAARYAGISYASLHLWWTKGREVYQTYHDAIDAYDANPQALSPPIITPQDQFYLSFYNALEEAQNEFGIQCLNVIYSATRVDPNWAYKMLAQKFPHDFAPSRGGGVEVGVKTGGESETIIRIQYVDYTPPIKIEDEQIPPQVEPG